MAGLREAGFVKSEKGHGGGWRLARPLREITLLAVYEALSRPNLFAIGNRSRHPDCLIEKSVNAVMAETMRSEEHTSELQSLMRISYAVFCLKKKKKQNTITYIPIQQTREPT